MSYCFSQQIVFADNITMRSLISKATSSLLLVLFVSLATSACGAPALTTPLVVQPPSAPKSPNTPAVPAVQQIQAAPAVQLTPAPSATLPLRPPFDVLGQRLIEDGFDATFVIGLYSEPRSVFDENGIVRYYTHREATANYGQFLEESSIKSAQDYLSKYETALSKAESKYGVPKQVIVGILLVETRLGTHIGKRLVLNTLSTLAALQDPATRENIWNVLLQGKTTELKDHFDKWASNKSSWAYRELKAYLQFVQAQNVDPFSMIGSFAGALGYSQFMPTSILAFGVDGNSDGHVNLYEHEDAIESIANYLSKNGWQSGQSREMSFKVLLKYNQSEFYANTILEVAKRLGNP